MSRPLPALRALLVATIAFAVPAATVIGAHPAIAQPSKPVDKKKLAKEYTNAGLAAQEAGDYDTALTFYAKAYELVPHPILLFNVAQAHRLAGRSAAAIDHYQKYLAADPKGPKVKLAQEFIIALEIQVAADASRNADAARQAEEARQAEAARAAEAARLAESARLAEAARLAESARKAEEGRLAEEARPAEDPPPTDDAPAGSPGRGMRIAGLGAVGVGAAAAGVGLFYFGGKAKTLSDELSQPGVMFDQQKYDDGEAANRNMIIATAAGGALIVGGVVLYVVGRKKGAASERVTVAPAVAPGQVGLVLAGRWP